jgi:hypothetical protein
MNERSRGTRYALSALKNKRAVLAGEIIQLERQLRGRRESMQHVDACLRMLDPTLAVESIPNKRLPRHINLFRQGELSRLVLDTLREADGKPLRTTEITEAIMAKGGIDAEARNVIRVRVRSSVGYLAKRGKVEKIGERTEARWCLVSADR